MTPLDILLLQVFVAFYMIILVNSIESTVISRDEAIKIINRQ